MKRYSPWFGLVFLLVFAFQVQAQRYYQPVPPFTPYNPNQPFHPVYPYPPQYPVYPPAYPVYGGAFFCGTPVGSCPIAPGPVGYPCFCNTWNGPIPGNVFIVR